MTQETQLLQMVG